MTGHRLLRRMEAAGLIHWWKQYPEPIEIPLPSRVGYQRAMWERVAEALR